MTEWTLNKNLRRGQEFQACGHNLRVVEINNTSDPMFNRCNVEDIGPLPNWPTLKDGPAPPLRFGGAR